MDEKALYVEKQYLGFNPYAIMRRSVLAIFLFLAYYFAPETSKVADFYFFGGLTVLVVSVGLLWVLHFETRIEDHFVILDGLWTSRKIKIDLHSVVALEKVAMESSWINRPAYHLHRQGEVKFYTYGAHGIALTDRQGTRYVIGSQRANELYYILKNELKSLEQHA